ncbi:MAG: hypothetical protein K6E10_09110 [Eubacterium sp.]|nr:hypothetical protein [Eubacterium sp.]
MNDTVIKKINILFLIKSALCILAGFGLAVFLNPFFSKAGIYGLSHVIFEESSFADYWSQMKAMMSLSDMSGIGANRLFVITIVFIWIISHFIFGIKKTFSFFFKYRWFVGLGLLIVFVANAYNGNAMDSYAEFQYAEGDEYQEPFIGFETPYRSDEVVVDLPLKLYYYQHGLPGDKLTAANVIQNPNMLISYVLLKTAGIDYAYSLDWYFYIILAFLVFIEFFLVVTDGKRLLSLASACMIFFSSFFQWWGFPSQLISSMGLIFALHHCITTKNKGWRLFYGIITAWFSIKFVMLLYPAWQVPVAYVIIVMMIWLVVSQWETLKALDKLDWGIIIFSILLMLAGMVVCYLDKVAYIASVSETVYPGERRCMGGYSLNKLFNYIPAAMYWFKLPSSTSETSAIISLFPIPTAMALYYVIKEKKKDIILAGLCIVTLLLLIYCSTGGLPDSLANLTLLSWATNIRVVDIIGFIQVIMLARVLAVYRLDKVAKTSENVTEDDKGKKALIMARLPRLTKIFLCLMVSGLFAVYSTHMANNSVADYMPDKYLYASVIILTIICYILISPYSYGKYKLVMIMLIMVSLFTGAIVRPIRKGLSPIYSKPASKAIEEIVEEDPDALWGTFASLTSQSFAKSCGADVLNYVNITPNMELWNKLDPNGENEEAYNRYAHIAIFLCEEDTHFELVQADYFQLFLSYKDVYKTNIKYMIASQELVIDNEYLSTEGIYQEDGMYIYKLNYKKTE